MVTEESPDVEIEKRKEMRRLTIKYLRKSVDIDIHGIEQASKVNVEFYSKEHFRCLALARTKLQEAKMWLGMSIGALELKDDPFPTVLRDFSDGRS